MCVTFFFNNKTFVIILDQGCNSTDSGVTRREFAVKKTIIIEKYPQSTLFAVFD